MTAFPSPPTFTCGLDATLRIIAGKWKPLIVYFLAQEPNRYGELRRAVRGVSDKMLIQHLKELEADGIVLRTDFKEVPPRVEYALTPLGRSLSEALAPLCAWGSDNMAEVQRVFAEREEWSRGAVVKDMQRKEKVGGRQWRSSAHAPAKPHEGGTEV